MAYELSLFFVAVSLPFGGALNSIAIVLLTVMALLEGDYSSRWSRLRKHKLLIAFAGFYACYLFGMLYTSNVEVGLGHLEKKLSLLVLPLAIGSSRWVSSSMRKKATMVFAWTTILCGMACFVDGLWRWQATGDSQSMIYDGLTRLMDFQAPYFAMYMTFSFVILWDAFQDKGYAERRHLRQLFLAGMLFAVVFIFLVAARISLIYLMLFLLFMGWKFLTLATTRQRIWVAVLAIVTLSAAVLLVSHSDYLQDRYVKPLTADLTITAGGGETGVSIRLVKWACSLEGISQHPLLGVGTGDGIDFLVSCYESRNFWGMYPQYRFNSHNQYLETWLALGVVGFGFLIAILFMGIAKGLQSKDFVRVAFLLLIATCFLTESVLERQWGVVFFAFFSSLFIFPLNNQENRLSMQSSADLSA